MKNHDTVLRFASVMFRIIDEIRNRPAQVLALQAPFLSSVSGSAVGVSGLEQVFAHLDPVVPFEKQSSYWLDKQSPFYYRNIYNPQIKLHQKGGVLPANKTLDASDTIWGSRVYQELSDLKHKYERLAAKAGKATGAKAVIAAAAKVQYGRRNYLDAARMIQAAV